MDKNPESFEETLRNPYGILTSESLGPSPNLDDLLVGPSRRSPLDSELAEASKEERSSPSHKLDFVSRVRELSIDSLFEFAQPFLRDDTSGIRNLSDQQIPVFDSESSVVPEMHRDDAEDGRIDTMTEAELESATDLLRDKILTLPSDAEDSLRTTLVQRLILYRLKLQEIQDVDLEDKSSIQAMGHDFQRVSPFRKFNKLGKHCEVCGQLMIFAPHQSVCLGCGFLCHDRCIKSISRNCVAEEVKNKPEFILDICPEKGLDAQDFACAECKKSFPMHNQNVWESHIRTCDYNGLYYCTTCHRNDLELIPGRVVKNWDFSLRETCRASCQRLNLLVYHPLLNLSDLNKELFAQVEELECVQKLRSRLAILYRMMVDCKEAPQIALLHTLPFSRKHLLSKTFLYSMNDLIDIERGVLLRELSDFAEDLERHVRVDCPSCKETKYTCVKCNSVDDRMYPFDEQAQVCSQCWAVTHKKCSLEDSGCIRCHFVELV